MGMGVVAALCFVCLLIGFLLGTRSRQLAASLKMVSKAAVSLAMFKIPAPPEVGEDDGGGDDDEDALGGDDGMGLPTIDDFLSPSGNTGFEDHPDLEFNPVLMYQVKMAKNAERERKRLAALQALQDGDGDGGAAEDQGRYKMNALSLLISLGARTLPSAARGQGDSLVQERKRQQKTVDVHLNKEHGVELKIAPKEARNQARGTAVKTAFEVAQDTSVERYGGSSHKRIENNTLIAKHGRNVLREWLRLNPRADKPDDDASDEDEEKRDAIDRRSRAGGGGAPLDPTMLAQIAAEFQEDADDWGDNEEGLQA